MNMKLLLGVVVVGVVAWSLSVLPKDLQQTKFGASIEEALVTADDKPIAADTKSAEISNTLIQAAPAPEPAPAPASKPTPTPTFQQGVIPILIDPSQVKPGGKVQVTVGAPDPVSLRSIEVFLESPDGLQVSRANIWNINGEGQWYDDISIPQDAKAGTWKIKTIEITDTEGIITPYSYGKEIFSTFTVE